MTSDRNVVPQHEEVRVWTPEGQCYRDVIQHNTFLTKSSVVILVFKSLICRIGDYNKRKAAAGLPLDSHGAPLSRYFFKYTIDVNVNG